MSKLITLTRIKDRELYRHCNSIEEMLSALEEEIIDELTSEGYKLEKLKVEL